MDELAVIAQLHCSGDPRAIPKLLAYVLSPSANVRNEAARALARLLSNAPSVQLPRIDQDVRNNCDHWDLSQWKALKPSQLQEFATNADALALLGCASFHPNGHVRETAVRHLNRCSDAGALGFLLVRANDWVEPVRLQAQAAALARVSPKNASAWVRNLPLITRLERGERGRDGKLLDAVVELLRDPACRPALMEGLADDDRHVRRACFRIVEQMEPAMRPPFLSTAFQSRDPLLRFWAAQSVIEQATLETLDELCRELQSDPFMPVRRAGIEASVQRGSPGASALLVDALIDQHASIRELARFHLARHLNLDVRNIYLSRLRQAAGRRLEGTLLGLGECGRTEDFDLVLPFLESEVVRLRSAALTAAGRLAFHRAVPHLMGALAAESPSTSRQAERIIAAHTKLIEIDELLVLLDPTQKPHVRRNAFRLVLKSSKWERLPPILNACADEDPRVQTMAHMALGAWLHRYNGSFAQPSSDQIKAAKAALALAGPHLGNHLRHELAALLSEWKTA